MGSASWGRWSSGCLLFIVPVAVVGINDDASGFDGVSDRISPLLEGKGFALGFGRALAVPTKGGCGRVFVVAGGVCEEGLVEVDGGLGGLAEELGGEDHFDKERVAGCPGAACAPLTLVDMRYTPNVKTRIPERPTPTIQGREKIAPNTNRGNPTM